MHGMILAAFLSAFSVPASGADEEEMFKGPQRFCGYQFAVDISADEQIGWRQPVHDFVLYSLQSDRGGFGIYEGNFPQTFRKERTAIKLRSFAKIERLRDQDGAISYLIETAAQWPRFIHLYGQAWKGDERDFALLSRVKVGDGTKIGCKSPTKGLEQDRAAK